MAVNPTKLNFMQVYVNGEMKNFSEEDLNLYQLLQLLELEPEQAGIAVAIDQQVVRRQLWPTTEVFTGCQVEIIRAVQGG